VDTYTFSLCWTRISPLWTRVTQNGAKTGIRLRGGGFQRQHGGLRTLRGCAKPAPFVPNCSSCASFVSSKPAPSCSFSCPKSVLVVPRELRFVRAPCVPPTRKIVTFVPNSPESLTTLIRNGQVFYLEDDYRGSSLIKQQHSRQDHHRALGIVLL